MNAYKWGLEHGSCYEALMLRKELGETATQADWWQACRRGDWLLWQISRLPAGRRERLQPLIDAIVAVITDRAASREGLAPEKGGWRGLISVASCLWQVATIGEAAAAAEAASRAHAGRGAQRWSPAVLTARQGEQQRQATEIHALIPEWPVEEVEL